MSPLEVNSFCTGVVGCNVRLISCGHKTSLGTKETPEALYAGTGLWTGAINILIHSGLCHSGTESPNTPVNPCYLLKVVVTVSETGSTDEASTRFVLRTFSHYAQSNTGDEY